MSTGRKRHNSQTYYGLFNDSYPPIIDGVTLTVENYIKWLSALGKTPCMVTPHNPLQYKSGVKIHRYFSLPIASRHPYRYGYPLADPLIWHRMRTTPFRLVHSHCPFSSGRLAVYAAKKQRIPLIGTFHSKYRDDLEHSFKRLPWMTDLIMGRILDFFNACDHVWIPQSKVEETVREYGFKGELTVVENGNDFADMIKGDVAAHRKSARERLKIAPERLSLLFVGQHIREKGVFTIIEALADLRDTTDFCMHFIGTGYAEKEMRRLVEKYGIKERVRFLGTENRRSVLSDYYAAADLFLFPSPYDNAPLVVREAAAMGTPSVLLRGSTAAEIIRDQNNGFLIDSDPREMASLIRTLASNREKMAETGINARKSVVRSWRDVVREVAERYDDILKTHETEYHFPGTSF